MQWIAIARAELQQLELLQALAELEGQCLSCGCTDEHGCDEGCWWVAPGLCSSCAGQASGPEELGP